MSIKCLLSDGLRGRFLKVCESGMGQLRLLCIKMLFNIAYAIQRGFYTAKAARPDVYRAANTILRLTTDGRILMSFKPPGFFETSTYEKLRVEEQKQLAIAAQEEQSNGSDDSDDSDIEQGDQGGKINITQGGAFALLADEMDD